MNERKLRAWREAGLVDEATAARILAWEAENARPLALWAAIGIGALAIGLGVVSVVAANWEEVPGTVRLALHLVLIAALVAFIGWRGTQLGRDHPWALEAALFVLAMLGMTFFGHLGQVYQTSSPLWQPLAVWLALFAPLLLSRGTSWLTAALAFAAFAYACWDFALARAVGAGDGRDLVGAFVTALPVLLAPLAAWMRSQSRREVFWKRLEQLALAYGVGGASLLCLLAGFDAFGRDELPLASLAIRAGLALAAGALTVAARPTVSGRAAGMVMAGAGATAFLAWGLSGSQLGGGVLFMTLWVGIAAAALQAGWRGVFQLAVAVVAIRLIVLSFELASDLLTSGFGLILAGLLILAIAWAALRVSRSYAPPKEGGA